MRVCLVSHRLGGFDGVSIEAAKWIAGLRALGHQVTRAAGHFVDREPGDVEVTGMWADRPGGDPPPVAHDTIRRLCAEHELLVLDNAGSLWSAPDASAAWQRHALDAGIPVILRHHDPAWQGTPLRAVDGDTVPLHHPAHLHVLINERTAREFAERWPELDRTGALRVVHNRVDVDGLGGGDRDGTRSRLGVAPDELLIVHPARAEGPNKNIPGAVRFAAALDRRWDRPVRYWLTDDTPAPAGPAADALATAPGPLRGHVAEQADMYAAADLVLLPSTWEGWGLPVAEAAAARRLVVAGPYPVLDELRALGLRVPTPDDVTTTAAVLRDPAATKALLDANHTAVRDHLDAAELPAVLTDLIRLSRARPHTTPA
ncbi:glycosyltransferase [Saccharopolyspora sp. NFXS83]|uniref:glycosyltransferase n=1 Tax=Saccharopolyspora sp. NFXS83 TaxID=2993560 RepID=UPI00224AFCBB|nr:glycosyltransferase [Saccharopolyspora sp. NFXS83]MCX2732129.1 glycosyltransferase [Saccharopolyspora sp. NFXS83]